MTEQLAKRCEDMHRRINSIADSKTLTKEAQTRAMALLLTLNADLFSKCADALRRSA